MAQTPGRTTARTAHALSGIAYDDATGLVFTAICKHAVVGGPIERYLARDEEQLEAS